MLKDIAKTRNPYGVLNYDFSIYAALFYIITNGYTRINDLKMTDNIKCNSINSVLANIKNADVLQKERKLQKDHNKLLEEEKIKKPKNKKAKNINSEEPAIKEVKKVKKISSTKTVKKTKKI